MSAGNQGCIRLIGHIIRTEVEISPITQKGTDTGTFFIQIHHIKLFARGDIRHTTSAFHDLQSLGSETLIIHSIYEIRILHIYRIKQTCFQTIFLIDQGLVSHFSIEISVITEQVSGHLDTYFGVDSRNKDRRIGGKAVKHPLTESFLVFHEVIIHPHFKRNRQKTSQQSSTGSFGKCRIDFRQSSFTNPCR